MPTAMLNSGQGSSSAPAAKRAAGIFVITAGAIGFSFVFACVTPFVALAMVAALNMRSHDVFAIVGLAWLANQIIGYGWLGYPQTWDSFAWGGAIGAAAGLAAWTALSVVRSDPFRSALGSAGAAFLSAFVVYELTLLLAGVVLPGSGGFSFDVIAYVFKVNAGGLVSLLAVHRLALAIGLVPVGETLPRRTVAT